MKVTIIGVGLIGGSLGIALKERSLASKVYGVDKNSVHAQKALELGLIDEVIDLVEGIRISDLVIIAIPVSDAINLIGSVLDEISSEAVVVDMGSTKNGICTAADNHKNRGNFVAAHPIAGTENVGPAAAIPALFKGKIAIVCEKDKSAPFALEVVKNLFTSIGVELIYMDPRDHDMHIAYVSHLSHISSFTLGLTVLEIEKNEKNIFNMAGSGFASTVRLAKSSADMWAPIFEQNAHNISDALEAYIEKLQLFKKQIDEGNTGIIRQLIVEANDIRRILEGIQLKE